MHYNDFEWILYREGSLSERMKKEMSEHLLICDDCLAEHLSTLEPRAETKPQRSARPEREKRGAGRLES